MTGFYVGQVVVTRRGKRGTVVGFDGGQVLVQFGGRSFPMRPGQLVSASSYDRAGKGYAPQR